MEFDKIKSGIKSAGPNNTRVDNDTYFEVVITRESIGRVLMLLEEALGRPAWPSPAKLPKQIQKLVDRLGGLRKGQTLFLLSRNKAVLFAMIWPWQDGERITIRLGKET